MFIRSTVLTVLVASGCASASTGTIITSPPEPAPVAAQGRVTDTILVIGVDLSDVGTQLGGNYAGLAKVYQGPLYVSAEDLRSWSQSMMNYTNATLQNAGYRTRQASTTFAQLESYAGVRFALAGKVSSLGANYYGVFAGNQTKAALTVTWEVFDALTRRVVFQTATSGSSTTAGRSADAVGVAFRVALSQLLSSDAFVAALARRPVVAQRVLASPTIASSSWRRAIPGESDVIQVGSAEAFAASGSILERAIKGVIALRGPDGHGSALMLTRDGLAITNEHVVRGQSTLVARIESGVEYPVRVIRSDSLADVALVEVACLRDCFTSTVLPAALPPVGTEVFAIGTPLSESLDHSVTKGVISGLRRSGTVSLIQTDAAVNPGNSGGPLVESATGRVIGIVSWKIVRDRAEGLAFAVSIQDALRVLGIVMH
jgi:S1-C subfamily serine protease